VLLILSYPASCPFFPLTSYAAITAHLWELGARLFLHLLHLTHPMLFRQVGFLHRCSLIYFITRLGLVRNISFVRKENLILEMISIGLHPKQDLKTSDEI